MKKYTNKILIITAIVLVVGIVIGYTIDFQTGYRSGRIKYEPIEKDTVPAIIADVETLRATSLQQTDTDNPSENEPKTSNQ